MKNEDPRDTAQTPRPIFAKIQCRWARNGRFDLDAAASDKNHLCDRYFTKEQNALEQDWIAESVFVNPPYHDLYSWVIKAHMEVMEGNAGRVVMLLPGGIGTRWWSYARTFGRIIDDAFEGRIRFDPPPGIDYTTPRAGSVLVLFERPIKTDSSGPHPNGGG